MNSRVISRHLMSNTRNSIRAEIEAIVPMDCSECETKAEVLGWIDSGVDLCRIEKPATPDKHLVSYFPLVDGEHILLVDHINAGLWLPNGGHVEPEEHPRETVIRELLEELHLEAEFLSDKPVFLTSTTTIGKTAGHTDISIWYVLRGNRDKELLFDETEFRSVRWFHKEDIPFERSDPQLQRFVQKVFSQPCAFWSAFDGQFSG